jgi:anti-sigma B factor antagonist
MKVKPNGDTLAITELQELGAANANLFRDQARAALNENFRSIDVDLSNTTFVDSCGLGALLSLHKTCSRRSGTMRLLNPTPPVQQILELTRMHRVFEIIKT